MARWLVTLRLDAPDQDTVRRRVAIHLGELAEVARVQSVASWEIEQEELQARLRRRDKRADA